MDPVQVPDVAAGSGVVTLREQRSATAASFTEGAAFPGVAVIGTTFAGSVALWNLKAQSMFGWTAAEAVGRPLRELLDVALTDEDFAEFVFIGGHGAWTRDLMMADRSGARFPVRMTATLAVAPDGTDELIATLQPLPAGHHAVTLRERPFRLIAER